MNKKLIKKHLVFLASIQSFWLSIAIIFLWFPTVWGGYGESGYLYPEGRGKYENFLKGYHWPPLLTGITDNSATIVWLQKKDSGETGILEYGTTPSYGTTVKNIELSDLIQHKGMEKRIGALRLCRARLKGLEPGTDYYYRVSGNDIDEFKSQFHTKDPHQKIIRLVVYGDHYYLSDDDMEFAEKHLGGPVDALLHDGDWFLKFYYRWRSRIPQYIAHGNHDNFEQLDQIFEFADEENGPGNYIVELGNVLCTFIKSAIGHYSERIDDRTKAFLVKELSSSKADWRFVLYHGDVYSSGHHGISVYKEKTNREDFSDIFSKAQADFVVHGHDHYNGRTYPLVYPGKRDDKNGTTYVIAGGGIGPFIMVDDWWANQPTNMSPSVFDSTLGKLGWLGASGFYMLKIEDKRLELYFAEPITQSKRSAKPSYLIRDRLVCVKDRVYVTELMTDLQGADKEKQDKVVEELGLMHHVPAATVIQKLFLETNDRETRIRYLNALARIGDPSTVGFALPFITDEDENVRYTAVDFIARCGSGTQVRKLSERFDKEESKSIKSRIIDGITRAGKEPEMRDVILQAFKDSPPFTKNALMSIRKAIFFHKIDEAIPVICDRLVALSKANEPLKFAWYGSGEGFHGVGGLHTAFIESTIHELVKGNFAHASPKYKQEIMAMLDNLIEIKYVSVRSNVSNDRYKERLKEWREIVAKW